MSRPSSEKGVALFFALIFILILSVLGISVMFVSQSETWSSLNYLEMTQARYGAEAGLNAAANYIVNTYCAPGNASACTNGNSPATGDTIGLYNTNVSPVTLTSGGSTVTLSTTSSAATYPVSSVETAFASAASGNVTAGRRTVNYTATATLVAMNQVTTAAGTQTVQTWSITATGTTGSIRGASVQVTGIVEQQVTFAASSTPSYGVFGTGNACGDLTFSGGVTIGSYDSQNPTMSGSNWTTDHWGGDIGSNGNLNESGGATVYGSFSTPRTGVGSCASGGVDAWSDSGGATVTGCQTAGSCVSGGLVSLSQTVTYATPVMPTMPSAGSGTNVSISSTSTCSNTTGLNSSNCSGSAGHLTISGNLGNVSVSVAAVTITGTSYGNISGSGGATVTLSPTATPSYGAINLSGNSTMTINPPGTSPATYNMTSLTTSGGGALSLSNTVTTTLNINTSVNLSGGSALTLTGTRPVTMNIVGTSNSSPYQSSGGGIANVNGSSVPTPANLTINYAGTHTLALSGGTKTAAAVYAPNAAITLSGGSNWYGSIIGSKITDSGGVSIYYDRELGSTTTSSQTATVGNFMMDSFGWSRF